MRFILCHKLFCLLLLALLAGCQDTKTQGEVVESSGTSSDNITTLKTPQYFKLASADVGNGEVEITYTQSSQATDYFIKYRAINSNTFLAETSTASPHTLSGLINGTVYVIKVTASNEFGEKDSNSVIVMPFTTSLAAPITTDLSMTLSEDLLTIITLPYFDGNGDPATMCSVANLTNVSQSKACSCSMGACTVGIKGSTNYSGGGSFTFNVTANGNISNSSTTTLTIGAVEDAPVAGDITPSIAEETATEVTLSYTDAESNLASSCSVYSLSSKLTVTKACSCTAGVCKVEIKGTTNSIGAATFKYDVTANSRTSNSANAIVTITNVNDTPKANNFAADSFDEDETNVDIVLSYSHPDNDPAVICDIISTSNVDEVMCFCAAGTCTARVDGGTDYFGPASFTFTVTDGDGKTSSTATANFTINAVDDIPVAYPVVTETFEDVPVMVTLKYTDADNDKATACSVTPSANIAVTETCSCVNGVCKVGVVGTLNLATAVPPDLATIGLFSYTVTANSQQSLLVPLFPPPGQQSTVGLVVYNAVDDAPVADIVTSTFAEDAEQTINLSYTDIEGDIASACSIIGVSKVSIVTPCTCTVAGACSVKVRGQANYSGTASFQYYVTSNGLNSNVADANLTISQVNDAPVAANLTRVYVKEDTAVTVTLSYTDIEGNKATDCLTDVNPGDDITESTGCSCTPAGVCTVGLQGSTNFYGDHIVSYVVIDAVNGKISNIAQIPITVISDDDPPDALGNSVPQPAFNNTAKWIELPYTDVDTPATSCTVTDLGSDLTVSPTHPCICLAGVCKVGIQANANVLGAQSFKYTVTASGATSDEAVVELMIESDDVPVGSGVTFFHPYLDETKLIELLYNDPDSAADSCAAQVVPIAANSNLVTVEVGACTCEAGVCKVSVKGLAAITTVPVFSYLSYTITSNTLTSAPANVGYPCPIGFILVPGSGSPWISTPDFCVMQYEASHINLIPFSHPSKSLPVSTISMTDAQNKCKILGTQYNLITNPEWMTIARNVESIPASNWIGGCMKNGNSGVDSVCGYNKLGLDPDGFTRNTKAALTLSNGSVIWDFSGNLEEWVLWGHYDDYADADASMAAFVALFGGNTCATENIDDVTAISCPYINSDSFQPMNAKSYLDSFGHFYGRSMVPVGLTRGGSYHSGDYAGAYTIDFGTNYTNAFPDVGYRCVYNYP